MLSILRKAYWLVLDSFFPPKCVACGAFLDGEARAEVVCSSCRLKMNVHSSLFCPSCSARVPGTKKKCHPDTSYLLGAGGDYHNSAIRGLVCSLKYDGILSSADLLGKFIALYLERISHEWNVAFDDFLIVPVPLHPSRERARGFNQSFLIAESAGKERNISICRALARIKRTVPQVAIRDNKKRRDNVAGCFSVIRPEEVRGRNILLIDDVFTTGATADEAVRTLRSAGARKIIVLVAAKA